ncbi:maintenance of telomere capping protein 1 [Dissophora ornata]|nr:hypothetical protein BGZ58_001488 [Dissophora ornata]KAI8605015.1 maintenance of telomere capping protein 1 [Dissophora ornata]
MSSSKDDVLQFLDSLGTAPADDSSSTSAATSGSNPAASSADGSSRDGTASSTSGTTGTQQDEQSVLDFLDEITQSASASTVTTPGATADSKVSPPGSQGKTSLYDTSAALPSRYLQQPAHQQQQQPQVDSRASWLGSLWSTASEAVKTTQTAVQSSVKATMESQATKNLEERVKGFVNAENIGKIGNDLKSLTLSSMTSVLDVIAPPIAEHEVVEIWLAHDMVGYVGIESIVNRSFSKVMEQTDGGDVVVHQGAGTSTQGDDIPPEDRQLNACEGYEQAVKLAKANIEHLVKTHYDPEKHQADVAAAKNSNSHASTCPVFMAIQPCRVPRHGYNASIAATAGAEGTKAMEKDTFVSFVLVLHDPTHKLEFESSSQSMPAQWLLIPYEENEWVEDRMVDCIRLAVGVIAQDYVWTRMKGDEMQRLQIQEAEAQAKQQLLDQQQKQEQEAKASGQAELNTSTA